MSEFWVFMGALVTAHMVADYPLQADHMAKRKHKDVDLLTAHAIVHTFVASILLFIVGVPYIQIFGVSIAYGVMHFMVDANNYNIQTDQTTHLIACFILALVLMAGQGVTL